ncbi:bile acid-transporting ATPase, partial [Aureobasidium melanogenum]
YAYKLVNPTHPHPWDLRIPATQDDQDTDDDSDEFDRNEHLAIHTVRTRNTEMSVVDKPRGQLLLPIVEELAVLAEVGIHAAACATGIWGWSRVTVICSTSLWSYVAVLTTLRLYFSSTNNYSFNKLWYHTGFLYAVQWICAFLLFRSAIIHPVSMGAQALTSTHFALTTLLTLIMLTSRKGNKPVELEYEGDIEPSREPLASVLSLATFSWVDPIVWKGYKKSTELSDVWNLDAKDKAEAVLANYRQVKKTSILAWHLLKYFKRGLLIQAAWAVISGVNLFVPTLLLKVILEYVENPADTPANAAWFYVILLFVSGVVAALS